MRQCNHKQTICSRNSVSMTYVSSPHLEEISTITTGFSTLTRITFIPHTQFFSSPKTLQSTLLQSHFTPSQVLVSSPCPPLQVLGYNLSLGTSTDATPLGFNPVSHHTLLSVYKCITSESSQLGSIQSVCSLQ